ncbi:mersacidin family lantibiotic [Aneurinibacillus tyrosinisolvens]|uniref:mersacidin family lantibiotic n=1 Tax=Aneurinibacillus tyrosinisolvens TaxID=1443435 RepID=UPI00063F340E|nr:mersacidin family lantibiotic [Aneurinibacillus tyrosinisolvens]
MNRYQVLSSLQENHPSGAKMVELSSEELVRIHGGGDVKPETVPVFIASVVAGMTIVNYIKN